MTTECRVVLLPSSQPLGNIPGEPQFISVRFSLLSPGFYRNIAPTFTDRGPACPLAVSAAHPVGRPHNHEAVVTLGARHRLEPHRGEAQPPVFRALGHRAAHSWEKYEYKLHLWLSKETLTLADRKVRGAPWTIRLDFKTQQYEGTIDHKICLNLTKSVICTNKLISRVTRIIESKNARNW